MGHSCAFNLFHAQHNKHVLYFAAKMKAAFTQLHVIHVRVHIHAVAVVHLVFADQLSVHLRKRLEAGYRHGKIK